MDNLSIPASGEATSASGSAKALVKGLALVHVVATCEGPVRLGDLVEASGLPRPTVLRLLDVLLGSACSSPPRTGASRWARASPSGASATSTASTCASTRRT